MMQTIAQYPDLLALAWGGLCLVGDLVHDLLASRSRSAHEKVNSDHENVNADHTNVICK